MFLYAFLTRAARICHFCSFPEQLWKGKARQIGESAPGGWFKTSGARRRLLRDLWCLHLHVRRWHPHFRHLDTRDGLGGSAWREGLQMDDGTCGSHGHPREPFLSTWLATSCQSPHSFCLLQGWGYHVTSSRAFEKLASCQFERFKINGNLKPIIWIIELPSYLSIVHCNCLWSHRIVRRKAPCQCSTRGNLNLHLWTTKPPWLHQRVTSKNCAVPKCDSRHGSSCWAFAPSICPPRFHRMDLLSFMHGGRHTFPQVLCKKNAEASHFLFWIRGFRRCFRWKKPGST